MAYIFNINILQYFIIVFTVTSDQFNGLLLNKNTTHL